MTLPEESKLPRCRAFDSGYGSRKKSKKQEKRVAGILGGSVIRGSGTGHREGGTGLGDYGAKGDVRQDDLLVEAKRTDANSLRVEGYWLVKISSEAAASGKHPALSIELGGMPGLAEKDWVLIPASLLKKLLKGTK